MVLAVVLGDPAFDPRVHEQHREDEAGGNESRKEHVQGQNMAENDVLEVEVPDDTRHEAQGAVNPADVPVRLRACGNRGGVVGTVVPDRVDGEEPRHEGDDTEHDEEEAAGLGRVHRTKGVADDVAVVAAGAGVLGVLVNNNHEEVDHNHQQDQCRYQEDVQHVEPADDDRTGELAAEQEERDVGTDHRDRLDDAVDDPQAVAGEQIVGERVAGEACRHGEDEQDAAHHPVQFAGLAERAGEEHAQHVDGNGSHEQQCGPVVHLAHEQAAADIKGDIQR
ncbi:hypothetical protein D9M72_491650 [compost metagenome]